MTLERGPRDGDDPGVGGPDAGDGEVGEVEESVSGDEVLSPATVGILGQEPQIENFSPE